MAEIVRITKGQPFALYIPLIILNADGTKEEVNTALLTDISAYIQSAYKVEQKMTTTFYKHFLVFYLPADLIATEYSVSITAKLNTGRKFSLRIHRAFAVVNWDCQSNWRDYIIGDHIELKDQPFIAGTVSSDAELDALKARYLAMLQQAEREKEAARQAKEELADKAAALDDIAKESTLTKVNQTVNSIIGNMGSISKSVTDNLTPKITSAKEEILQAIEDKAVQINDITTEDINNLFA